MRTLSGIRDSLGRHFANLRVSLTSACNYACSYCVPQGQRPTPLPRALSGSDLVELTGLLVRLLDIRRLRITGGEPLIAPGLEDFLAGLGDLQLEDLALTTNGQYLADKLEWLVAAGVRRLNVSLDTLDSEGFGRLAGGGDLEKVLKGIRAADQAGMALRLNMVPLRRHNLEQVPAMLDFALSMGAELRYIELMRMGHLARGPDFDEDFVPMDELLALVARHHSIEPLQAPVDSTALRFAVLGAGGERLGAFGIIANESQPFCRSCTRLRLTSNGELYGCLSSPRGHSIAHLARAGDPVAELAAILPRALADKQSLAFTGADTPMIFIGG